MILNNGCLKSEQKKWNCLHCTSPTLQNNDLFIHFLTFWPGSGSGQGKNMRIRADPDSDPNPKPCPAGIYNSLYDVQIGGRAANSLQFPAVSQLKDLKDFSQVCRQTFLVPELLYSQPHPLLPHLLLHPLRSCHCWRSHLQQCFLWTVSWVWAVIKKRIILFLKSAFKYRFLPFKC